VIVTVQSAVDYIKISNLGLDICRQMCYNVLGGRESAKI